jgi:hypothetical protein
MKLSEIKEKKGNGHFKAIVYVSEFNNIGDLVDHCNTGICNTKSFPERHSVKGTKSFTMTSNYSEAQELLLNGWDEGAKKLTSKLNIANRSLQTKEVRKMIYDIVGFQANVPLYLQGVPTNMVNYKKVKKEQKVITLVKSVTYLAMVSAERIMEDSIKFLQIVQAIEAKGIRVNIDVVNHTVLGSSNEEMLMRVRIKKASERLNISKMSFPLLHPSFFRRIIFRVMEDELRVKGSWGHGYGRPASPSDTTKHLAKGEYYIPVLISQDAALDVIKGIN